MAGCRYDMFEGSLMKCLNSHLLWLPYIKATTQSILRPLKFMEWHEPERLK